jgi:hypothetical protein
MKLPGVEREHQAGLDELARSFVQGRDGMALSAAISGLNGMRRRPSGSACGRRSGNIGNCRQSRSRTVSGRGSRAGWGGKVKGIGRYRCHR